jgi:hypothetical protein
MSIENITETVGLSDSEIQEVVADKIPLSDNIVSTDDILVSPDPSDD